MTALHRPRFAAACILPCILVNLTRPLAQAITNVGSFVTAAGLSLTELARVSEDDLNVLIEELGVKSMRIKLQIKAAIEAVKKAKDDDSVGVEELKEKVEDLKKASMKIGEAMYKNTGGDGGDGGAGGETKAEYEDVKKDEKKD